MRPRTTVTLTFGLLNAMVNLASEDTTTSKQLWGSNLTSDLKSVTPITYLCY